MRAVMAYRMSRGGNSNEMRRGGNQNNYGESRGNQGSYGEMRDGYSEMRQGGNRNEYGEMRGNHSEMRRSGNRNAYDEMGEENGGAESRYRGRDGRWKAGRRRSKMDGGMDEEWPEDARAYEARNEYQPKPNNYGRVENRYKPEYPIAPRDERGGLYDGGNGLGFGTRDRQYETRSHYDGGEGGRRQSAKVGGMMWMEPQEGEEMKLDRKTAEEWVRSMRNEDTARPTGGRWSMEELKPMAQKMGISTDPEDEEFLEFWAMTNAMYSDYCTVAKKFNITSPEFYGMMAKAWMDDKDAMPNKTAMYYMCCVKKES